MIKFFLNVCDFKASGLNAYRFKAYRFKAYRFKAYSSLLLALPPDLLLANLEGLTF